MDHFRSPRGTGRIVNPDCSVEKSNLLCGDKIYLDLLLKEGKIYLAFEGEGCAISQASASILCERCHGKPLVEVQNSLDSYNALMATDDWKGDELALGDIFALNTIKNFPARLKCCHLAWDALEELLKQLKS